MPLEKTYREKILKAFGKISIGSLSEEERRKLDELLKGYDTTMPFTELEEAIRRDKNDSLSDDEEYTLNLAKKVLPTVHLDDDAIRNGFRLYANAKGHYESCNIFQRMLAHVLPSSLYKPAYYLKEKNVAIEVIKDLKLNLEEANDYANDYIKSNTIVEDFSNPNGASTFKGVNYIHDYEKYQIELNQEAKDILSYDRMPEEPIILDDDEEKEYDKEEIYEQGISAKEYGDNVLY